MNILLALNIMSDLVGMGMNRTMNQIQDKLSWLTGSWTTIQLITWFENGQWTTLGFAIGQKGSLN